MGLFKGWMGKPVRKGLFGQETQNMESEMGEEGIGIPKTVGMKLLDTNIPMRTTNLSCAVFLKSILCSYIIKKTGVK